MFHIVDTVLKKDTDSNEIAVVAVFEEFIGCAVSSSIASSTFTFQLFALLLINNLAVFQNQIRKDSIVKTLKKAINPSLNTNPFNHDTNYMKLYTSVKDGPFDKDEYGQLNKSQYLDDVLNFKTTNPSFTRKVRVDLGRKEYLNMREVQVWDYSNVNRALGKTATQSNNFDNRNDLRASMAVDNNMGTRSETHNNISEYHISACNFPKYHVSF